MATRKNQTYTITEFIDAHKISRTHFYLLRKENQGPRMMKVGRKNLISAEAAAEWRRRMEGASVKSTKDIGPHTPGPWAYDVRSPGDIYAYVMPSTGGILSTICRVELSFANERQGIADARLIASAPDLLLALKNIIASATDKAAPEIAQAIAAIRKATSEKAL